MQVKNPVKGAGNTELASQFNNERSDLDKSLKAEQAQLMESVSCEKETRILWEMYTIFISFVLDSNWPRNVIPIDLALMMIRDWWKQQKANTNPRKKLLIYLGMKVHL